MQFSEIFFVFRKVDLLLYFVLWKWREVFHYLWKTFNFVGTKQLLEKHISSKEAYFILKSFFWYGKSVLLSKRVSLCVFRHYETFSAKLIFDIFSEIDIFRASRFFGAMSLRIFKTFSSFER